MDYLAFYRQIDEAYKELIDINRAFSVLRRRAEGLSCRLEELASDATKIKDEEKSEKLTAKYILFKILLYNREKVLSSKKIGGLFNGEDIRKRY